MRHGWLPTLLLGLGALLLASAASAGIVMEAGALSLPSTSAGSTTFQSVTFSQPFSTTPLVFVVPSNEGGDPCDVRIRNVTAGGFEVVQVEPSLEDGAHGAMSTAWFAIEPGIGLLPDGTVVEAGSLSTTTTVHRSPPFPTGGGWDSLTFSSVFGQAPALLAQVQTIANEQGAPPGAPSSPWLTAAVRNLDRNGAQLSLERAEVNDDPDGDGDPTNDVALPETLGYVAITSHGYHTPFLDDTGASTLLDALVSSDVIVGWTDDNPDGSGKEIPFHEIFGSPPLVVANLATRDGADGGWVRRAAAATTSVRLTVDEDQFNDSERGHTSERASVLALSGPMRLTAIDLPSATLRYAASKDTTGNRFWENIDGVSGYDWNIASNNRSGVTSGAVYGIGRAYNFPQARGTMTHLEGLPGNPTNDSASFEIWFKPDDLTGQEILLEFGGSGNGTSLAIDDTAVLFTTSSGSAATTEQLSWDGLSTVQFLQAVGVVDLAGSAGANSDPDVFLYINGMLASAAYDIGGFGDWAGSDGSGLGRVNGSPGGNKTGLLNGFGNFSGQIAIVNFYEQALSQQDVYNLYRSVAIPEPATLSLLGLGALALLTRRRRG